jgi:hypothetical protein
MSCNGGRAANSNEHSPKDSARKQRSCAIREVEEIPRTASGSGCQNKGSAGASGLNQGERKRASRPANAASKKTWNRGGNEGQEYKGQAKTEKFSPDHITSQLEIYREAVKEYRKELANAQTDIMQQRNKWLRQKKRDLKQKHALQEQQRVLDDLGISISFS